MSDPPTTGPPIHADHLGYLRKQAKVLLRDVRRGDPAARERIASVLGLKSCESPMLSHAQLVIAREAGFESWPKLQDDLLFREQIRAKHRLGSATLLQPGEKMYSNQSLHLGPIDQIGLSCTDLEEAQRFYCNILGLRLAAETPIMKCFNCAGVNIIMFKGDSVPPNSVIYFRVPPQPGLIEEKVKLLKSKGVKVEADAHVIARNYNGCDVYLAFFRDPFGNLLAFKSDVPLAR